MTKVIVHGPSFPGYTKTILLTLEEKGIDYDLRPFDFPGRPDGFERLNPFLKVPVIEHDDIVLYEASAIARYLDEAFDGPTLQPATPIARGRMNQIVSIMDQIGAPLLLRTIYTQRFIERVQSEPHDEAAIRQALPVAQICIAEFERVATTALFLAGKTLSLADLFVFPSLAYFADTVEGEDMLSTCPALRDWMTRMSERPSVQKVGLPELLAPKAA